MSWEDLKEGDTLFIVKRKLTLPGKDRKIIKQWAKVKVGSVSRVFYSIVGGGKFRKDKKGAEFLQRFYLPGSEGVPSEIDEGEEEANFQRYQDASRKLSYNSGVRILNLDGLDIFVAAKFADEFVELQDRVKQAREESARG